MGVLARTKVVLVKLLVSMICDCRRILWFFFSLFCFFFFFRSFFSVFSPFFFYLRIKQENKQKNLSLPKKKSCILWFHVSTSLSCSVYFSLGMLWWTAVNLYSSCKLIVRKLYRFLYFGRKVFFFSVIKDFLSWHHNSLWIVSSFTSVFTDGFTFQNGDRGGEDILIQTWINKIKCFYVTEWSRSNTN